MNIAIFKGIVMTLTVNIKSVVLQQDPLKFIFCNQVKELCCLLFIFLALFLLH